MRNSASPSAGKRRLHDAGDIDVCNHLVPVSGPNILPCPTNSLQCIAFSDWDVDLQARRERNRKAQTEFRRRRQVAERSRDLRLQLLEDVVGEMATILTDFCDELLRNEAAAKDPNLVACLRRSSARVIALVKTVHPEETVDATATIHISRSSHSPGTGRSIESILEDTSERRDELCHSEQADNSGPYVSSNDSPPATSMEHERAVPGWSLYLAEMAQSDSPRGYDFDSRGRANLDLQPVQRLPPWIPSSSLRVVPFPLRLVKTTLAQAYLFLRGDLHISSEDIHRSFGNTLRLRTREQLISHLHGLLGRRIDDLSEAAGMAGTFTHLVSAERPTTDGTSSHAGTAWDLDTDGILNLLYSEIQADAFLTAFGVYKELNHLGARMLDPETMEINISGVGLSTSHHTEGELPGTGPSKRNCTKRNPAHLTCILDMS
ncbi:unnamed protein product [Clonostachys rhizophaga]|uniref:BZIP domain-containing protein n=1 Tax=Clonostachys rhizophaga TaxID=160324 RepID=A0A9N9VGB6_9HYPO|nr:unnamed protein product [Clonostachys rhizophaga]